MDPNTDHIVPLDSEHPGFRDQAYRQQRDKIARAATKFWEDWNAANEVGKDQKTVPIPVIEYTEKNRQTWRRVFRTLHPLHKKNAISGYLEGLEALQITEDKIPQLAGVSEQLEAITGFRLVPIEGLVRAREVLTSLLNREFPATQYIRHH